MMTIGIDPGLGGAIAALDDYHHAVTVEDMPVIKVGTKRRLNIPAVLDIISGFEQCHVALEHVSAMPHQGVTSCFTFGEGFGVLQTAILASGHSLHLVRPAKWKRAMGLTKDKHHARKMATERWPQQWGLFKRVKDDGRAEACLLAAWMRRELGEILL